MEQYIPKSVVLAEIENLQDKGKYSEEYDCAYRDGNNNALFVLKAKISTIKAKDVDLEKELDAWRHNHFHGNRDWCAAGEYLERSSQLDIVEYFFNLGLKAQELW